MFNPSATVRGILLASIGTVLFLIAAGSAFYVWRDTSVEPAAYLPAKSTVALLYSATSADITRYESLFPILSSVPALSQRVHVGIVHVDPNTWGWVLFPEQANQPLPSTTGTSMRIGGMTLVMSGGPQLAEALQQQEKLLNRAGYRELLARLPGTHWIMMQPALITADALPQIDAELLSAFPHDSLVAYTPEQGLFISSMNAASASTLHTSQYSFIPKPSVVALMPQMPALWEAFASSQTHDQLARHAQITSWAETLFGKDISVPFDLLPLMRNTSRLEIGSASGQTLFLLAGEADVKKLTQTMSRIHASVTQAEPGIHIVDRTLDEKQGFRMRAVMEGTDLSDTDTETEEDNWTIRESGSSTVAPYIITATHNRMFVVANDRDLLYKALEETAPTPSFSLPSHPLHAMKAGGIVEADYVAAIWPRRAESVLLPLFAPQILQNKHLHWSVSDASGIGNLLLE